jgi:hypothetical protein
MFNKVVSALLVCFALSACNRGPSVPEDPKRRLSEYISRSFSVKSVQDREDLLTYLTGEAKTRLAAWSPDQFHSAFIESKRQFIKLVFNEMKSVSPNEVNITYELTYLDQGRGHDAKVTNKKLSYLILQQGRWLIRDVHNIKELVEYRNEMALP